MSLAGFQEWPDCGVAGLTNDEKARSKKNTPSDKDFSFGNTYYPRKPKVNVNRWLSDYRAKLRSLERAEGI
jgi:hypothetical protein